MMKHAKIHTKTTSGALSFGGWGVEESFIVRDLQNVVARERRRRFSRYAALFLLPRQIPQTRKRRYPKTTSGMRLQTSTTARKRGKQTMKINVTRSLIRCMK